MLKLYLWGYFNGIRSSRKLENEYHWNLEAMWLINRLTPDFKTIADFRKDNLELIKRVFAEFNIFLEKLGLFKSHEVAIDGTKVKATNFMDRSYTREYLKPSIGKVSKLIEKYLKEMDENDKKEEQEIDRSRAQEAVKKLNEKKEKLVGLQDKIKESGMTEIPLTNPEARQMKTRHGVDVCYNCHIAVEVGKHFITDYTVDNSANDYWSVVPLAKESLSLLGNVEISTDKGHFSLKNLDALSELGIKAYMPSSEKGRPKKKTGVPEEEFSKISSLLILRMIRTPALRAVRCITGSYGLMCHLA
jgi:hypothetical protein